MPLVEFYGMHTFSVFIQMISMYLQSRVELYNCLNTIVYYNDWQADWHIHTTMERLTRLGNLRVYICWEFGLKY